MQYSIVFLSEIENCSKRLDSEYYQRRYLEIEREIKKFTSKNFSSVAKITDGEHGTVQLQNKGIKYLTAENIKNGFVDTGNIRYITKEVDKRNARSRVKPGDILISIKGTLGEVAIADISLLPANMNRDVAVIKKFSNDFNSEFLAVFFMSRLGKMQLCREGSGGVQQMITLGRLSNIKIPVLSEKFQSLIKDKFYLFNTLLNKSRNLYVSSQNILLSELGLINWQPKHQLSFVRNFSEAKEAGRMDAEYFQPQYDELLEVIKETICYSRKIGDIQTYNSRGLQPDYAEDGKLDVIASRHILENGLDYDSFEKTDSENWNTQKKARVYKGDILTYTTGANIGRTACYAANKKALASNHVNVLRVKGENSEYVAFVMNSMVGRLQTKRLSAGSAQAELYPKDIENYVIPFIGVPHQQKIVSLIEESRVLKEKSQHLLECAKRAVELAIEQDEQTAIDWLEKETGASVQLSSAA